MSEWITVRLSDIADLQIGGTPSRENQSYWASEYDFGFPWVSIADLNKKVIFETKEKITRQGALHSNVKFVSAGTLIMSFKLTIGRIAYAGIDLYTNEAIVAICFSGQKISPDLLYFILPGIVENTVVDTAVKGKTLNKKSLGNLRLSIPVELSYQKKIAHILQTIDRAIESTQALIEKYQLIKAGLMHDLFTRGIGTDGKLRPPREAAPRCIRKRRLGGFRRSGSYKGFRTWQKLEFLT